MLTVKVSSQEWWDEGKNEFVYSEPAEFTIEHSLYSVAKWEMKYKKPFLNPRGEPLTRAEFLDYIWFMIISPDPKREWLENLDEENYKQIKDYLDDDHTASTIISHEPKGKGPGGQFITSELLYSYMVGLRIPFECQHWNLNRLMMLIRMCNEQNQPKKKMPKDKNIASMSKLNAARRARLGSKG